MLQSVDNSLRAKKNIVSKLGGLVSFILIVPSLSTYGFSDDYSASSYLNSLSYTDSFKSGLAHGRPLLALLAKIQYGFVTQVDDFYIHRIFAALLMSFFVVLVLKLLMKVGLAEKLNLSEIVLMSIVIFCSIGTSGFMILYLWPILLPALFSLVIASLGIMLFVFHEGLKRVLGTFLILVPLFTYQPVFAFVFCLTLFLMAIMPSDAFLRLIKSTSFKCSLLLTLILVLVNLLCIAGYGDEGQTRGSFSTNISVKISWLLNELLLRVFSFQIPSPSKSFAVIMTLLLLASITRLTLNTHGRIQKWIMVSVIPLSLAPNVITEENWSSNRSIMAVKWWVFFILISILASLTINSFAKHKSSVSLILASILIASTAFQVSHLAVNSWKIPNEIEMTLIRSSLDQEVCSYSKYLVPSSLSDSLTGSYSYDEFGRPSTYATWAISPIVEMVCKEKGVEVLDLKIINRSEVADFATNEVVDFGSILASVKQG